MKKNKLFWISLLLFTGCATQKNIYPHPQFSYNLKDKKSMIDYQKPDYGDGRKDGCIVMGEMFLQLNTEDKTNYSGKLIDVTTSKPIEGALIQLTFKNSDEPMKVRTDKDGLFSFSKNFEIVKIQVNCIGYRHLVIDGKGKI